LPIPRLAYVSGGIIPLMKGENSYKLWTFSTKESNNARHDMRVYNALSSINKLVDCTIDDRQYDEDTED